MFWNYLCQPAGWAAQADLSAGAVGRAGPGAFPPAALALVWEARLLLSTKALTSDSWSCSQGMGSSNFHIYKLSMETFSPVVTKLHLLWSIELWLTETFFHQNFGALDGPSFTSLLFPSDLTFCSEKSFFCYCLHSTSISSELVRRVGYLLAQYVVEF